MSLFSCKHDLVKTAGAHVVSFQVRVVVPYQGPSSDSVVVRMIPDSRLPPRHLHAVHTGKTSAVIKWESPYDSPDQDLVRVRLSRHCCLFVLWAGVGRGPVLGQEPSAWWLELSRRCPHFCLAKDGCLLLVVLSPLFQAAFLLCVLISPSLTFQNGATSRPAGQIQAQSGPSPAFVNGVL